MHAIELLKSQHEEVTALFEKYEKAKDSRAKIGLFVEIADSLAAHATIEEKIFYPAVYVGDLQDMLKEAVEEHLSAKRIIADLLEMKITDSNFDAKVKVLKEQIEHHVEEEENEVFPKVKKGFQADELNEMGTQMEALYTQLQEGDPRKDIPAETDEAAPLH